MMYITDSEYNMREGVAGVGWRAVLALNVRVKIINTICIWKSNINGMRQPWQFIPFTPDGLFVLVVAAN